MVRDVDLAREKGETESLKVGSIIQQELLAAAAMEGVFLGGAAAGPAPAIAYQAWTSFRTRAGSAGRSPLRPGLSGTIDLNPPRPSFPVPVPYPRPHP